MSPIPETELDINSGYVKETIRHLQLAKRLGLIKVSDGPECVDVRYVYLQGKNSMFDFVFPANLSTTTRLPEFVHYGLISYGPLELDGICPNNSYIDKFIDGGNRRIFEGCQLSIGVDKTNGRYNIQGFGIEGNLPVEMVSVDGEKEALSRTEYKDYVYEKEVRHLFGALVVLGERPELLESIRDRGVVVLSRGINEENYKIECLACPNQMAIGERGLSVVKTDRILDNLEEGEKLEKLLSTSEMIGVLVQYTG